MAPPRSLLVACCLLSWAYAMRVPSQHLRTFERASTARLCAADSNVLLTRDTIDRVKSELWRASEADPAQLAREQGEVVASLLKEIAELPVTEGGTLDSAALNALVAPQLPVLLGRSFPQVVRNTLTSVRTEGERTALLALCSLVTEVQQEIGDTLTELQWRQQQKLRELCDAATDGGTERVIELAQAMKEELDTDFCNYLNFAIEEEENRLKAAGLKPYVPPTLGGSSASPMLGEAGRDDDAAVGETLEAAGSLGWKSKVDGVERPWGSATAPVGSPPPSAASSAAPASDEWDDDDEEAGGEEEEDPTRTVKMGRAVWKPAEDVGLERVGRGAPPGDLPTAGPAAPPPPLAGSSLASASGDVEQQQWLLILRVVRQGIYSMLSKDYIEDVRRIRYIIGLASADARSELTSRTLLAMTLEQQQSFAATLERIVANLSVQVCGRLLRPPA